MRAIILAGGKATRLYPLTYVTSKQLLPVYDKPMIYYPLQTVKDLGANRVLIITANESQCDLFKQQLKHISSEDFIIEYAIQEKPKGIAEALIIGEKFINGEDFILALGDNVFVYQNLDKIESNTIFAYKVNDPSQYGVVELNDDRTIKRLVEKPKDFISDLAVVGLYVLSPKAVEIAKRIKPSPRGELEIVDVLKELNDTDKVNVVELDGFWFDCGTHNDLLDCANLVRTIQTRTNKTVGIKL